MLTIITIIPRNTRTTNEKDIQASAIAAEPRWHERYPCVVDAMTEAAEAAATCCHMAAVRRNKDAIPSRNMHVTDTGLDGKGLISTSDPVCASRSSCQPGKVANPRKASTESPIPPTLKVSTRFEKDCTADLQQARKGDIVHELCCDADGIQRIIFSPAKHGGETECTACAYPFPLLALLRT